MDKLFINVIKGSVISLNMNACFNFLFALLIDFNLKQIKGTGASVVGNNSHANYGAHV